MKSADFIREENDEYLLVAAGTDGYKANIRIVNHRDKIVKNIYPDEGKFTQVSFVKIPKASKTAVMGFIAGTEKGNLMLL